MKNGQKTISLLNLDTPPKFDLVIVDEAHHIRNTGTYVNKAVRHFCDFANAAIFLTATPLQMCNHDLYVLLNVLRPDLIDSYENFQEMCKPNQFINEALSHIYSVKQDWQNNVSKSLSNAIETEWGKQTITNNPSFYLCKELLKGQIEKNNFEKRVELTQSIENLNIFSNLINRTRRNDVESFCTRHVKTMEIPLTEEQRHIYKKILCLRERLLMRIHNTDNVNMIMATIKRQTTSCVFGLAPYIKSIVNANINGKSVMDNDSMNVELPITMSNTEIQGFQTEADTILYPKLP